MPAQFLLNLCIALLWMLLNDEDELRFITFFTGYLVGAVIVFLMHRLFGERFYLARFFALIKLLLIFNWEILQSSIHVIRHILSPKIQIRPGIFRYETELRGEWEIPALALLLTLTPDLWCLR